MKLERGYGILQGIRDIQLSASNITSGVTGMIFSVSGVLLIFSNVASEAGMSQRHVLSWFFAGFFIGGLLSIIFSLYYKLPIVMASSLPAVALVGMFFKQFEIGELVGGFIISGLLIFIIGLTGMMDVLKRTLPIPIVMGMIAGIFMNYALKLINEVVNDFWVCGVIVICFFVTMRFMSKIPPQLIALITAVLLVALFRPLSVNMDGIALGFAKPMLVAPTFSPGSFISIAIPITMLAIADCIKGYGVLKSSGYDPPMNVLTLTSGAASVIAGLFLSHPITLAGAGTAIVATAEEGKKDSQYAASVLKNMFSIILSLTIGFIYPLLNSLPVSVSNVLAGLAMLSLFTGSLEGAFSSGSFKVGAFAALAVGLSDVSVFSIGAPVWALLVGVLVSAMAEPEDFHAISRSKT